MLAETFRQPDETFHQPDEMFQLTFQIENLDPKLAYGTNFFLKNPKKVTSFCVGVDLW